MSIDSLLHLVPFHEPGQPRLVCLARVPADDAPHGRVGFERRRVDSEGVPLREVGVRQPLQHPCEHRPVRLDVDQAAGARQRRVVRGGLVQRDVQEVADAQRIRRAPRDGPLGVQALKVPEQQQPKLPARRQTRAANAVGRERRALGLDEGVEARVVEHVIQSLVKRVPRTVRQVGGGDPHCLLPRPAAAFPHGHARQGSTRDRFC